MPIFTYYCLGCDDTFKKLVKSKDEEVIHSCGDHLKPQLPTSINAVTREMKDARRGVSHIKGQDAMLKRRMNEHHDKHEVQAKIDEHGTIDAKKFGWDKRTKRL